MSDISEMLDKLEKLYDSEYESAEKRYNHNKELAISMENKLKEVCSSGNDVVYSYAIEKLASKIKSMIFSYEENADDFDVVQIERKINNLSKRRERERDMIFKEINMYERNITNLKEKEKLYKKPDTKLADMFLDRVRKRG